MTRRASGRNAASERTAQREADHQRWADDGGFTPDPEPDRPTTPVFARSPWVAVVVAAGVGFALAWLVGRRPR